MRSNLDSTVNCIQTVCIRNDLGRPTFRSDSFLTHALCTAVSFLYKFYVSKLKRFTIIIIIIIIISVVVVVSLRIERYFSAFH